MSVSVGGETLGVAVPKADGTSGAATDGTSTSLFGATADAGDTAGLKALSDWLSRETAKKDRSSSRFRTMTEREVLMGSSFSLAAETGGGGFASLWGRMAQTRFAGREDTLSLDGDVTTGLLARTMRPGAGRRAWWSRTASARAATGAPCPRLRPRAWRARSKPR